MREETIVRENLMNEKGYTPYCGSHVPICCSNPRTFFQHDQFHCPECGWTSQFPSYFIERYKQKWNFK